MVDLEQFASLEDALAKADVGRRYVEVGKVLIPMADRQLTLPLFFFLSMITRSEGLQGAIVREIRHGNPHAVVPLIRAFAEATAMVAYVHDYPGYIDLISRPASDLPNNGPKRKSIQALLAHASKHAPGMKIVYAGLSEGTHFGATAMWAAHTIESEEENAVNTSWASTPRWRTEHDALVACALTIELAEGMDALLRRFAAHHLLSAPPDDEPAIRESSLA